MPMSIQLFWTYQVMFNSTYIILGSNGLVGSYLFEVLKRGGAKVIGVNRENYRKHIGEKADFLINCNGNSVRYKANQEPNWDFSESFLSVFDSINDFRCDTYIYISSADVYNNLSNIDNNHEGALIEPTNLNYYSFHKWLSERLVSKYKSQYIILRLGAVLGPKLKKGPIYDMLNGQSLHMSLNSKITFIDVKTIFDTIKVLIGKKLFNEIYNVTGSGVTKLSALIECFDSKPKVGSRSKDIVLSYNINVNKLSKIIKIKTSTDIAKNFIHKYK
jgi:nucleoside-diphosphate-sugar epimerase